MSTNFYTAVEIASLLKISKALAYRLIAKGEIGSIRFGKTVRVSQEAIENFIAEKESSSNSSSTVFSSSPSYKRQ
jgi:excisionase family DNA binding protein